MADPIAKLVSKIQRIELPSANVFFSVVLVSFFLITSGIVYDIIVEPPAMGSTQDPKTGAVRPQPVIPYRINAQYIMEGLTAGAMYTMAAVGILLLNWSTKKTLSNKVKLILIGSGSFLFMLCYSGIVSFIQIKLPGYLH